MTTKPQGTHELEIARAPILLSINSVVAGPSGCFVFPVLSGTRIIQRWVSPDVAKYQFDHVLTICITKDQSTRQMVEDAVAARARKGNALPSYNILQEGELRDKEQAKRKILQMGFDGAV